jgi:cytidine deaminase
MEVQVLSSAPDIWLMKTIPITEVSLEDQKLLQEAVSRLPHSLNKVTNPSTSAIAQTKLGCYYGNNIFLSNDTLVCAEANALASAAAAGDHKVSKLFLAITRTDSDPQLVSPCGNCRQWLHDFARLNGQAIKVLSVTSKLKEVLVTDSDELLPEGFKSAGLGRMAGEK